LLGVVSTLAGVLVLVVVGCAEPGSAGSEIGDDDGAVRGELAAYVADFADGHSQTTYFLRAPSGAERPLVFDGHVDEAGELIPGTQLKVWGIDSPAGLRVTSFRRVSLTPDEVKRAPLINGTAYAPRSFAFVLVDISGQGFKPAITEADVLGRMINNADSIRNYYISDSYGRQDITTQVIGPIKYTMNGCSTSSMSAGPGQLAADLRSMVPGTFQHYLWYFGTDQQPIGCDWQGLASLGTPDKPSKDTWYNASTNCVVLVQEPGHNFGMQHSSSLACPGASFLDNPATCTASEYGDLFDPMGNGCRHMNAWQKAYQGWFGGCNGVAITSSGTFTLLPFESRCDGAQFLKIKAPKARTFNRPADGGGGATVENLNYYYVELRTPVDFDGTLGNRTAMTPSVLIHVADDLKTRTQRGLHTFLLDMTPTTTGSRAFTDAALPVGQTFNDPGGGLSITATAVSATQATITVTMEGGTGAPTCLDGSMFEAPGPGPESCGAAGGANGTGSGGAGAGTGGSMGAGGRSASGGAIGGGGRSAIGGSTGAGGREATGTGSGGRGGASANGSGGTNMTGEGGKSASSGGQPGTSSGGSGMMASGGAQGSGSGGSTHPSSGSGGQSSATGTGGSSGPMDNLTVEGGCNCATGGAAGGSGAPLGALSAIAFAFFASGRRRRRR